MTFIPVPSTIGMEWFMTLDAQEIEMTYYAFSEVDITVSQLNLLSGIMENWWIEQLAPVLSFNLVLRATKCTDLSSDVAPAIEASAGPSGVGGVAQSSVANSLAFVVKHTTAGRGRSSRGRCYVPGIPNTSVVQNTITATLANALVAAFADLDTRLPINDCSPVVVSRYHDNAPRAVGLTVPILNHSYTDLTIDNQRRRKPGVGT